jgi:hypothetical protein
VPFTVRIEAYACADAERFWTELGAELGPKRTQQVRALAERAAQRTSPLEPSTPTKRVRRAELTGEGSPALALRGEQRARRARPLLGPRGAGRGRGDLVARGAHVAGQSSTDEDGTMETNNGYGPVPAEEKAGPDETLAPNGDLGMRLPSNPLDVLSFLAARSYGPPQQLTASPAAPSKAAAPTSQPPSAPPASTSTEPAVPRDMHVKGPQQTPMTGFGQTPISVATLPDNAKVPTAEPAATLNLALDIAEPDARLAERVTYLNQLVRVRRELAVLVRLGAATQPAADLPALVPEGAAYTLAGIAASLFAIRPWEVPSSAQERCEVIAKKIRDEEAEHVRHISALTRRVCP